MTFNLSRIRLIFGSDFGSIPFADPRSQNRFSAPSAKLLIIGNDCHLESDMSIQR